jgi:DNA-binding response OmpR family regulator
MKKIFVVEDDAAILKALEEYLQSESYEVKATDNGGVAIDLINKYKPDLILLDLILPGKNGIEICRELRLNKNLTPIIMLTSKSDEIDKVLGLELGADDYMTKPFSLRELSARIKAILRRSEEKKSISHVYNFSDFTIDLIRQEVFKKKKLVEISLTEFKLLEFFIKHEGEVLSREKLLNEVWGYDSYPSTRTVDNFVLSLRKIIEADPANPKHLITMHKAGYKFVK